MNEQEVAAALKGLLDEVIDMEEDDRQHAGLPEVISELRLDDVATFETAGVMTTNAGLVLCLADGSEFQLTIVQSRAAD